MLSMMPAALGLVLALLLGVPTMAGSQDTDSVAAPPVAAGGDFAGLVDISGRSLYLECAGQGSPTVVLEAGFRTRADLWSDDLIQPEAPRRMVFPGVAAFTRVCAYDRPGTTTVTDDVLLPSRSDPVAMPRTAADSVRDLHALLEAAEVPGPYVLVGHSYGGMLMRLYASTYSDEVVGMVLVDAFSEGLKAQMTAEQWTAYAAIFQPVPKALAGYPDLEFTDLDVSASQVRDATEASPLPSLPVVVLSRGQPMTMPADLPGGLTGEGLEREWTVEQDRLAALLPGIRHVIAGESEHYIQLQQPELVIAAIQQVVDAVHDPSSWATPQATPTVYASPVPASGDFAGLVDVGGGRGMYLTCRGEGRPTVVLEAGAGNDADIWDTVGLAPDSAQTAVLPGVGAFTRVCAYDRPGTLLDLDHRSRSDPVPQPRTAADTVEDLHALLSAAGVPGPYVLVGHSLGGIIIRLYAATYPGEVVGLVLVDSSHEEQSVRFQAALTPGQWAAFERLQQQALPDPDDVPDLERMALDTSFAQLRTAVAAQPLPSLPLVVLTRGVSVRAELPLEMQSELPPDFPFDTFDTVWQELQVELAALVPDARHVAATESGHYIQLQQPELVIAAIQQVVEAVRDPSTWATPTAGTPAP